MGLVRRGWGSFGLMMMEPRFRWQHDVLSRVPLETLLCWLKPDRFGAVLSCRALTFSYAALMSPIHMRLANALQEGACCTYARHRFLQTKPHRVHDHDYYEVFWVEKGPGIHDINGQHHEVVAGTVQLIRPSDRHSFYSLPGQVFEGTNVAFPASVWRELQRRYFPADREAMFDRPGWQSREFTGLAAYIGDLRHAASDLHAGRRDRLALDRFLLPMLGIVASRHESSGTIPRWLRGLRQELRQQVNFISGVPDVIARSSRCHPHVCREYRRYYGKTPTEEMTEARMRYAAQKLRTTDLEILDIALQVGLSNLGYFYRIFREQHGCSPAAYRREHSRI